MPKGMALSIETLVIIVVVLIILLSILSVYFSGWNPFSAGTSIENAKNEGCADLIRNKCDKTLTSIKITNFDANKDGNVNDATDNLDNLCKNFFSRNTPAECKALCNCGAILSGGGGGPCTKKQCGVDFDCGTPSDGCLGFLNCGGCTPPEICTSYKCVSPCVPNCVGKDCGNDGCGGSCGTCPPAKPFCVGDICQAGCTPDCTGKVCGNDGCGGSCPPGCPLSQSCVGGVCVCTPKTCADYPRQCGSFNNGCGGTITCSCQGGQNCVSGICQGCISCWWQETCPSACSSGGTCFKTYECTCNPHGCGGSNIVCFGTWTGVEGSTTGCTSNSCGVPGTNC